jgi:hypothetical protein
MKRLLLAVLVLAAGATAAPASAADLCVGGAGCFGTLQAAVTASHDGDTIRIRRGTFAGGVTVDKSVAIVGAGAGATTIAGGGPVLTIFKASDPTGLTVSIRGVTITGGVNDSEPDPEVTFGGGIWIPTSQLPEPPFNGAGATVSIADSVVTGNVVTSHAAIPPGPFCGPHACGFNSGGGIDNGGVLTITDSRITNNTSGSAGSLASGVGAGGILSRFAATLVLRRTVVSGNRAVAAPPNGSHAQTGGVGADGEVTIEDSLVADNTAEVHGTFSAADEPVALAGGIHVGACCGVEHSATIRNTIVRGNRATAEIDGAGALAVSFAGGVLADAPLLIERTAITDNLVRSTSSAGDAAADGGGIEVDSAVTIRDSVVARNAVVAEAQGAAGAVGGGIANAGQLTVVRTLVLDNRVRARGAGGLLPFGEPSAALGGGIWNGAFGGPPPTLTLTDSVVVANSLDAPSGFVVAGGGLYTTFPVTRTRVVIAGNRPDQCSGC